MELEESSVSTAAEERLPPAPPKSTFPLRLPRTMRLEAAELACLEGVSLNQFVVQAVAEKVTRLQHSHVSRGIQLRALGHLEQVKAI